MRKEWLPFIIVGIAMYYLIEIAETIFQLIIVAVIFVVLMVLNLYLSWGDKDEVN